MKNKTIKIIISILAVVVLTGTILLVVGENRQDEVIDPNDTNIEDLLEQDNRMIDIPSIKEPPANVTDTGKPDIDVSEMDRSTDPEVIDVAIEYGTKEGVGNEP